jgi:predicted regulator of Ras-like GTPase activity (Roadblock/LC7/MglB family)
VNAIQELLDELREVAGVSGAAVVTSDGIMVSSVLKGRFRDDVVAGLASFLITTTRRAMGSQGNQGFSRFIMHATHGKVVLVDIQAAFLVVITDQFVDMEPLLGEVDEIGRRLARAAKLPT